MSNMKIGGLQKLTLLDFPGKVACTVFTVGCNFRCPFCHNAPLVTHCGTTPTMPEEEFFSFLKKRQGILDGVAITGGEPTLMSGLYDFIGKIKDMGFLVKLDTNGTSPELLKTLIDNKMIDYAAMDIKNSKEKYAVTSGLSENYDLSKIYESADILMQGKIDFEFRTTLVSPYHTEDDMESIGRWLSGDEKFYLQNFVDSGDLVGTGVRGMSYDDAIKLLSKLQPFITNAQLRGY